MFKPSLGENKIEINLYLWTLFRVVRLTLAMKICQKNFLVFFIYTDLWKTFPRVLKAWYKDSRVGRTLESSQYKPSTSFQSLLHNWASMCGLLRTPFSSLVFHQIVGFQRNLHSISRIVLHLASTKPESCSLKVKYTFLGRFLCFNCTTRPFQT